MAIPEKISTQEAMMKGPSRFARVGECATDPLSDTRATSNRRQRLDPWECLAELVRRTSLILNKRTRVVAAEAHPATGTECRFSANSSLLPRASTRVSHQLPT